MSLKMLRMDTLYRKLMRFHSGLILSRSMRLPAGGVLGLMSSAGGTLKSAAMDTHVAPIEQSSDTANTMSPSFQFMM